MKPALLVLVISLVACAQPAAESTTTTTSPAPSSTARGDSSSTTSTTATSTTLAPTTTATTAASPSATAELAILFVGNSHTRRHDIPETVASLLQSGLSHEVDVMLSSAAFLRTASKSKAVTDAIASGEWDVVVLQGQELSQSHSIAYSQEEGIALAQLAIDAGARALFFSEWRRRGIDETRYIEDIYAEMAATAGAEVIPIGRAWDRFLDQEPGYGLWANDGNHSSPDGAFLAAATIAYYVAGPDTQLTGSEDEQPFLEVARATVAEFLNE